MGVHVAFHDRRTDDLLCARALICFDSTFSRRIELWVKADDVDYSQKSIKRCFNDGAQLQDLVRDLNEGNVHPGADDFL
jgi:hypothetical protein